MSIPWAQVLGATVWPRISWKAEYRTTMVAVFGTTISPYLFFWQAPHWSDVINGVIAVPIMAVMMLMSVDLKVMGRFTVSRKLHRLGWLTTGLMGAAVLATFATL